jgi:hypothetical protein
MDRHVLEIEETDGNADGKADLIESTRYTYDAAGLLVREDYEYDFRADGVIEFRSTKHGSYDTQNRVIRLVEGYYDGPGGTFLPHVTYSVTFDDAARLVIATSETDFDRDGVTDDTIRMTALSDAAGRHIRGTWEADYYGRPDGGGDGTFDSLSDDRYEYDASGYLVRNVYEDFNDGVFNSRIDSRFVNDRHGRVVQTLWARITSLDPDELPAEMETTTHLRDQHGRVVDEVRHKAYVGQTITGSRSQYVYDPLGDLLERVDSSWWFDDPPAIDSRMTFEYGAGRSGQGGED